MSFGPLLFSSTQKLSPKPFLRFELWAQNKWILPTNFQLGLCTPNKAALALGILHPDPLRLTLRHVARLRHRDRYVPRRHRRWWRWYHPPVSKKRKGNPPFPPNTKKIRGFPTLTKGVFFVIEQKIPWICGFGKMDNKHHIMIMTGIPRLSGFRLRYLRLGLPTKSLKNLTLRLPSSFGVDCLH